MAVTASKPCEAFTRTVAELGLIDADVDWTSALRRTEAAAGDDGSRVTSPGSATSTVAVVPEDGAVQVTDCAVVDVNVPAEQLHT